MLKVPNLVLLGPTTLMSLLVSLVITWLAWECFIPGRAFRCLDAGFDVGFWMSAETHRSAGDEILPGWTWERLDRVSDEYKLAFLALWMGASFASFHFLKSILKQ